MMKKYIGVVAFVLIILPAIAQPIILEKSINHSNEYFHQRVPGNNPITLQQGSQIIRKEENSQYTKNLTIISYIIDIGLIIGIVLAIFGLFVGRVSRIFSIIGLLFLLYYIYEIIVLRIAGSMF